MREYFIRHKLDSKGNLIEIKVSKKSAMKEINSMIKKDRDMLKTLEKL